MAVVATLEIQLIREIYFGVKGAVPFSTQKMTKITHTWKT